MTQRLNDSTTDFKKGADCKPGSVSRVSGTVIIPLTSRFTPDVLRPTRILDGPSMRLKATSFLALHQMGFTKLPCLHGTGELLPHLFTLTVLTHGGVFSVALSLELPPVPVRNHFAL